MRIANATVLSHGGRALVQRARPASGGEDWRGAAGGFPAACPNGSFRVVVLVLLWGVMAMVRLGAADGAGEAAKSGVSGQSNSVAAPGSAPGLASGATVRGVATVETNGSRGAGGGGGGSNSVSIHAPPSAEDVALRYSAEALRSYLRLQEQMHTALLAIHQARAEASAEAQTNMQAMLGRMESLERDLAVQRVEEAQASRNTNRFILLAAGGMFLLGLVAMVTTAVIQARGMNRLAEIAMGLGAARSLAGGGGPAALAGPGGLALPGAERLLLARGGEVGGGGFAGSGEEAAGAGTGEAGRLQSTIRHLEDRIREMETAARGGNELRPSDPANSPSVSSGGGSSGSLRAVTLAKAQALLNLGQAQAALGTVEEAINREPNDAEMHLRKGMALERLKRYEQAIAAYDRAILLDARCTQAYLCKGSVLNQQSRYQEALACYEQALEHRGRSA